MSTFLVPDEIPTPVEDALDIRKAVEGWGTDEKVLISVLAHRNADQRKLIQAAYEELYKEDLTKRIKSELSGDFETALLYWILDPVERDAVITHDTLKSGNPDYKAIVEIACILSPEDLLAVKRAYQKRYSFSLEEDVASHTTGDIRKILVALVSTYRYDGDEVKLNLVSLEANIIHDAIVGKTFNHDDIIRIFGTRSKAQLTATFDHYKEVHGASLTKKLVGDPADEFLAVLRAAVRCISNPTKYFEKVIRHALKKVGTDEDTLTRVVVRHAEKDLEEIKNQFQKRNNVPLEEAIEKETSGDYKEFMLALLGNEEH